MDTGISTPVAIKPGGQTLRIEFDIQADHLTHSGAIQQAAVLMRTLQVIGTQRIDQTLSLIQI